MQDSCLNGKWGVGWVVAPIPPKKNTRVSKCITLQKMKTLNTYSDISLPLRKKKKHIFQPFIRCYVKPFFAISAPPTPRNQCLASFVRFLGEKWRHVQPRKANGIQPPRKMIWLVVEPTHLKNMLVKLDHFPRNPGESKKYLKPPPSDGETNRNQ